MGYLNVKQLADLLGLKTRNLISAICQKGPSEHVSVNEIPIIVSWGDLNNLDRGVKKARNLIVQAHEELSEKAEYMKQIDWSSVKNCTSQMSDAMATLASCIALLHKLKRAEPDK